MRVSVSTIILDDFYRVIYCFCEKVVSLEWFLEVEKYL
jgi:hypothetical protein